MLLDVLDEKKLLASGREVRIFNFVSLIAPRFLMISGDTPIWTAVIGISCCLLTFQSYHWRS